LGGVEPDTCSRRGFAGGPGRPGTARWYPGAPAPLGGTDEEIMKRLIALVAALGVAAALLITAAV